MTVLAILVDNIHFRFTLASGINIVTKIIVSAVTAKFSSISIKYLMKHKIEIWVCFFK